VITIGDTPTQKSSSIKLPAGVNIGTMGLDLLDERHFTNGMVYLRSHTQALAPGSER
jgi:hypothetical protein